MICSRKIANPEASAASPTIFPARHPRGVAKYKAFTLVELLVVVTIVTILAALLLPVLRSTIETARCVTCMSNEKQIYVLLQMYSADYSGYLPTNGANSITYRDAWHGQLLPYLYPGGYNTSLKFMGYPKGLHAVFTCPKAFSLHMTAAPNWETTFTSSNWCWRVYYNGLVPCNYGISTKWIGYSGSNNGTSVILSKVPNPEIKLMMMCSARYSVLSIAKWAAWVGDQNFIHGNKPCTKMDSTTWYAMSTAQRDVLYRATADEKSTFAYLDGHVRLISRGEGWDIEAKGVYNTGGL